MKAFTERLEKLETGMLLSGDTTRARPS